MCSPPPPPIPSLELSEERARHSASPSDPPPTPPLCDPLLWLCGPCAGATSSTWVTAIPFSIYHQLLNSNLLKGRPCNVCRRREQFRKGDLCRIQEGGSVLPAAPSCDKPEPEEHLAAGARGSCLRGAHSGARPPLGFYGLPGREGETKANRVPQRTLSSLQKASISNALQLLKHVNGEVSTVCGGSEFLLSPRTPLQALRAAAGCQASRAKGFSWRFLFSTFCHHGVTFNNCVFLSQEEQKACFELVADYRQKGTHFSPSGCLRH